MIQKDLNWTSKDGINIVAHTWEPEEAPKAAITLVHGFGEHCVRYTPYFNFLVNEGFAILGFDLRGHGKSDGKRGAIKSYNVVMDDIETALNKTKKLFPTAPQFIYGHSMGGNLAFNYLLKRKPNLAGGILTSPWLALANDPNFLVKGMVTFLKNFIPNLTINSGMELKYISTDTTEVDKYRNDPLNHGRISFRLFSDITKTGLWAIAHSNKLQIPVLLMHGSADKITSPLASKLAAKGNKEKIEFVEWPGKYHELHNETNRSEIAQSVINWINKKL